MGAAGNATGVGFSPAEPCAISPALEKKPHIPSAQKVLLRQPLSLRKQLQACELTAALFSAHFQAAQVKVTSWGQGHHNKTPSARAEALASHPAGLKHLLPLQ